MLQLPTEQIIENMGFMAYIFLVTLLELLKKMGYAEKFNDQRGAETAT